MAERRTRRSLRCKRSGGCRRRAWVLSSGVGRNEAFRESEDQQQSTLLPDWVDDYVTEENSVRVIEVFSGR